MYTIRFLDYDGTIISSQTVDTASEIKKPTNPTREYYTFEKWDKDFSSVTEDMDITALYVAKEYTIKFTYYRYTTKTSVSRKLTHFQTLDITTVGTTYGEGFDYRTGYTWNRFEILEDPENYTLEGNILSNVKSNLTFESIYDINTYKITLDYYDHNEHKILEINKEYNTSIKSILEEYSIDYSNRPGYIFIDFDPYYKVTPAFDINIEFVYKKTDLENLKETYNDSVLPKCDYYTLLKKLSDNTVEYNNIIKSDHIRFDKIYKYRDISKFACNGIYTDLYSAIDKFYNLDYEQKNLPSYSNLMFTDYLNRYNNKKYVQDLRFDKSYTEITIQTSNTSKKFILDKLFLLKDCEKCTIDWGDGVIEEYTPNKKFTLPKSKITIDDEYTDVFLPSDQFERTPGQKVVFYRTEKYKWETEYFARLDGDIGYKFVFQYNVDSDDSEHVLVYQKNLKTNSGEELVNDNAAFGGYNSLYNYGFEGTLVPRRARRILVESLLSSKGLTLWTPYPTEDLVNDRVKALYECDRVNGENISEDDYVHCEHEYSDNKIYYVKIDNTIDKLCIVGTPDDYYNSKSFDNRNQRNMILAVNGYCSNLTELFDYCFGCYSINELRIANTNYLNYTLKYINLPYIKKIGDCAISGFYSMEKIHFDWENLDKLGYACFLATRIGDELYIPKVKVIPGECFAETIAGPQRIFAPFVEHVGQDAFTTYAPPDRIDVNKRFLYVYAPNCKSIGGHAFYGNAIIELYMPNLECTYYDWPFYDTQGNLKALYFPKAKKLGALFVGCPDSVKYLFLTESTCEEVLNNKFLRPSAPSGDKYCMFAKSGSTIYCKDGYIHYDKGWKSVIGNYDLPDYEFSKRFEPVHGTKNDNHELHEYYRSPSDISTPYPILGYISDIKLNCTSSNYKSISESQFNNFIDPIVNYNEYEEFDFNTIYNENVSSVHNENILNLKKSENVKSDYIFKFTSTNDFKRPKIDFDKKLVVFNKNLYAIKNDKYSETGNATFDDFVKINNDNVLIYTLNTLNEWNSVPFSINTVIKNKKNYLNNKSYLCNNETEFNSIVDEIVDNNKIAVLFTKTNTSNNLEIKDTERTSPDTAKTRSFVMRRAKCIITINYYNGTESITEIQDVLFGGDVVIPENYTRTGYDFDKWEGKLTDITEDGIVNAVYNIKKFNVVLNYYNRTEKITETQTINYGDNFIVPENYQKSRSIFIRWSVDPSTPVTSNLNVNAIYESATYKVEFHSNNGVDNKNTQTISFDSYVNLQSNTYTFSNHTFKGWALSQDGDVVYTNGQKVYNITDVANEVVKLYAVWQDDGFYLCPHKDYYVKMASRDNRIKYFKIDLTICYKSKTEIFERYNKYVDEDCVRWYLADSENIYSCDCDVVKECDYHDGVYYPPQTVWFVKIQNIETGTLTYMTTKYNRKYPKTSFRELFNNLDVPEGYRIYDRNHLYICKK